jgi:hypothetical protein
MANALPLPVTDPLVNAPNPNLPKGQKDVNAYGMTDTWAKFFGSIAQTVSQASSTLNTTSVTAAAASIITTNLPLGQLNSGLYRVTWYARITRAASSSSSLTITLGWTDGGVAITQSGAAITGNTTATYQSLTYMIHVDRLTEITYATTYSSTGGTTMQYSLYLTVENVASV